MAPAALATRGAQLGAGGRLTGPGSGWSPRRAGPSHYGGSITPFSPHWQVTVEAGQVRCCAGNDSTHLLAELSPEVIESVAAWVAEGGIPEDVAPEAAPVAAFFSSSGIAAGESPRRPLRWREVGSTGLEFGPVGGHEDVEIIVRTNGSLADLTEACAEASDAHVLVDLCAHHTVSIGPLAHVGFTACGGCYAARLTQRWGDPQPPDRPRLVDHSDLAMGLLQVQLDRPGPTGLLNGTISLDLESGLTRHHRLLRSPSCLVCGPADIAGDGRLVFEP